MFCRQDRGLSNTLVKFSLNRDFQRNMNGEVWSVFAMYVRVHVCENAESFLEM